METQDQIQDQIPQEVDLEFAYQDKVTQEMVEEIKLLLMLHHGCIIVGVVTAPYEQPQFEELFLEVDYTSEIDMYYLERFREKLNERLSYFKDRTVESVVKIIATTFAIERIIVVYDRLLRFAIIAVVM